MSELSSEICNTIGNVAFCEKLYEKAIHYYTLAINKNPNESKYFCNRSAAYLCFNNAAEALEDANKAVELKPDWDRCYSRQASAFYALQKWADATNSCTIGLGLNSNNSVLNTLLEESKKEFHQLRDDYLAGDLNINNKKETVDNDKAMIVSFLQKLDDETKPIVKVQDRVTTDDDIDILSSQDIIDRLTGNNSEWRNLNPYWVLMLPATATEEDIKQRYFKMSSKVHPDKCKLPDTRYAFEAVKEASKMLSDKKIRENCLRIINEATEAVHTQRAKLSLQGSESISMEDESKEIEKAIMLQFAEEEQQRRKTEHFKIVAKRKEIEEITEEQKRNKENMKNEEEWNKTIDNRVDKWRKYIKENENRRTPSTYVPPSIIPEKRKDTSTKNTYKRK